MNVDQSAMCYISMDLSQRVLLTNGMFFTNFIFVFELLAERQKYLNEQRGVNIDQSTMCYLSMDLAREALLTNGKLFFKFRNHYFELTTIY